jgi:hypothetical protein
MTTDDRLTEIENELKIVNQELDLIKDIISQKGFDIRSDYKDAHRISSNREVIAVVLQTAIIIICCFILMMSFIRIKKEIDNIATPTGFVKGNVFYPFPSDSKIVRWPDNYQKRDTTK